MGSTTGRAPLSTRDVAIFVRQASRKRHYGILSEESPTREDLFNNQNRFRIVPSEVDLEDVLK